MDEKTFQQAVMITAAFIQNGDIRCAGNTNIQTTAMAQVNDLIVTLYTVISEARKEVEELPFD